MDLKSLRVVLEQLESERGIPKEKILGAIEDALAAAYKKDYGKRGQIIRSEFDPSTGTADFFQIKKVVDESMVRIDEEEEESKTEEKKSSPSEKENTDTEEEHKPRFNPEQHILLEEARKIKKGVKLEEEIVFPLETKADYGRIAAQTAKQVIIQRIREAERTAILDEYEKRKGEIVSGIIQRVERGTLYVDLSRAMGIMPRDEQIPGEYFKQGERIKAYLYAVEERPNDVMLLLSRSHPKFLSKLLEIEVPEIANGTVEIKSIAREAGSRSKIAVFSNDEHIDPVGSCVGQRGVRVATVMSELGGEKIDVIEWVEEPTHFIEQAISPARIEQVELDEKNHRALIEVTPDQYSLAIGSGGQNARLAARLTGWKIDIRESSGRHELKVDREGEEDTESKSQPSQEDKAEEKQKGRE